MLCAKFIVWLQNLDRPSAAFGTVLRLLALIDASTLIDEKAKQSASLGALEERRESAITKKSLVGRARQKTTTTSGGASKLPQSPTANKQTTPNVKARAYFSALVTKSSARILAAAFKRRSVSNALGSRFDRRATFATRRLQAAT